MRCPSSKIFGIIVESEYVSRKKISGRLKKHDDSAIQATVRATPLLYLPNTSSWHSSYMLVLSSALVVVGSCGRSGLLSGPFEAIDSKSLFLLDCFMFFAVRLFVCLRCNKSLIKSGGDPSLDAVDMAERDLLKLQSNVLAFGSAKTALRKRRSKQYEQKQTASKKNRIIYQSVQRCLL